MRPDDRDRDRDEREEWVYGVHPVAELLEQRPGRVERILTSREKSRGVGPILKRARHAGIPVTYLSRDLLSRKLGRKVNHQGVAATVAPKPYAQPDDLAAAARDADGILVLLDRVVDPGNLGATLRSAAGAGATGVLLPADATVGVTPAVLRSSAGAAERIDVARVGRPARWLEARREEGFRVAVLDARADTDWDAVEWSGPWILVAGGEQRGVRPALSEAADVRVRIPLAAGWSPSMSGWPPVCYFSRRFAGDERIASGAIESSWARC